MYELRNVNARKVPSKERKVVILVFTKSVWSVQLSNAKDALMDTTLTDRIACPVWITARLVLVLVVAKYAKEVFLFLNLEIAIL